MKLKPKYFILLLLAVLVSTAGFRCSFISPKTKALLQPVTLEWWGVFDNPSDVAGTINTFRARFPHVTINYRKLRFEEYEDKLLEALAEDRGPDIFALPNTWLRGYLPKIEQLPPQTVMATQRIKETLGVKKDVIVERVNIPSLTSADIRTRFLQVVNDDVVIGDQVYGLPLAVDTLALFYNRDLLDNASIALPPKSWREFQDAVKRLTFQNRSGQLVQSGAALGTSNNVERATDIISLLMMQNGAKMMEGEKVTFNQIPAGQADRSYQPGTEALRFYTDFAAPSKEVYTWNKAQPNNLQAFAEGRLAFFFGYSYHVPQLEASSRGKLNFEIVRAPQIEGNREVNFTNYQLQVVSKKSSHINEAWNFIQFAATEGGAQSYLTATGRPTALRSLVDSQTADPKLGVFASELLTATSWYKGVDAQTAEAFLAEMIDSVSERGEDPAKAINLAAGRVQQTIK